MNRRIPLVASGLWLLIAVLAIANGTLRQAVLVPVLGDATAQVLSVLILGVLIAAIQWRMVHGPWRTLTQSRLALIGCCWMVGTILFEFALGRLVLGMGWTSLLQQYNVAAGNLWPLIPLLMLLGMPLMKRRVSGA